MYQQQDNIYSSTLHVKSQNALNHNTVVGLVISKKVESLVYTLFNTDCESNHVRPDRHEEVGQGIYQSVNCP